MHLDSGTVVVVGVRSTNLDAVYREHPRVVVWESTDPKSLNKDLPTNARAVVMTRFVDHTLSGRIIEQARQRNLTLFPMLETGQIKAQLDELLDMNAKETPKEPPKKGQLKDFVAKNSDPNANVKSETSRLMSLASKAGIKTTPGSVEQAIRVHRRSILHGKPSSILTKSQQLVKVLDDCIAGLELLREEVQRIEKENSEMKAKLEAVRRCV